MEELAQGPSKLRFTEASVEKLLIYRVPAIGTYRIVEGGEPHQNKIPLIMFIGFSCTYLSTYNGHANMWVPGSCPINLLVPVNWIVLFFTHQLHHIH